MLILEKKSEAELEKEKKNTWKIITVKEDTFWMIQSTVLQNLEN